MIRFFFFFIIYVFMPYLAALYPTAAPYLCVTTDH